MMLLKSQKGFATLVFSIVVLLLVTFVSLYTSKSIITETKITSNDYRSKQAFEAAELGVNQAFYALKEKGRPCNDSGVFGDLYTSLTDDNLVGFTIYQTNVVNFDPPSFPSASSHKGFVVVEVRVPDNPTGGADCTDNIPWTNDITITSTGYSDDLTSQRTIVVNSENADGIDNVPENPLTARGVVGLTGNVKVYNQEGATTVWSGSGVNVNAANKNYTYIASPDQTGYSEDYPECMDTSSTCNVVAVTADGTGVDIIANDSTLANLSETEFFENFFGMTQQQYRNTAVTQEMLSNDIDGGSFNPQLWGNEVIWVDMSPGETEVRIPAGTSWGCSTAGPLGNTEYFTNGETQCEADSGDIEPIILVVNGNLNLPANAHIFGLVFVIGDVISAGNPEITGALVSYGAVGENGAVIVRYNSSVIVKGGLNPNYFITPGGWRDF